MKAVLERVRKGGYEYRRGVNVAKVTAIPKRERNCYPAFFYDEGTGWGIVDHRGSITELDENWNEVKDALTMGARKVGMI